MPCASATDALGTAAHGSCLLIAVARGAVLGVGLLELALSVLPLHDNKKKAMPSSGKIRTLVDSFS
jgi:hypothetical protein